MRITLAVVADYVNVAKDDKLNVSGVFDTIYAESFPAIHPSMVLAVRIQAEYPDSEREYAFSAWLEDADGGFIAGIKDEAVRAPTVLPGEFQSLNIIMPVSMLTFAGPGKFTLRVKCDDEVEVPFRVVPSSNQRTLPAS